MVLKGSGTSGTSKSPEIGTLVEIEAGLEADDIRKRIMKFDFTQRDPVLFQLLGFIVAAGKGMVRTSLDNSPTDSSAPVPVGTQMSRVEQGLKVFSAIHGRVHSDFNAFLRGLARLDRMYLPEKVEVDKDGDELVVYRKDFDGESGILPSSDPTIYSDQQRFAQLNYIQSRMQINPQLWRSREVELAGLRLIKWPNPESILQDIPTPKELNAVNENLAILLGRPVVVFPEQDHLAHLQVLLDFMNSPIFGQNPLVAPVFVPAAIKHAIEHMGYFYVQHTLDTISHAASSKVEELMSNNVEVKQALDRLIGTASGKVIEAAGKAFGGAMPVLIKAAQLLKSLQPPPPMDPAAAAVQAAAAETARKSKADIMDNALNQQQAASKQQNEASEIALEAQRVQAEQDGAQLDSQTKILTTHLDNQTALDIASTRIPGGAGGGLTDGESLTGT